MSQTLTALEACVNVNAMIKVSELALILGPPSFAQAKHRFAELCACSILLDICPGNGGGPRWNPGCCSFLILLRNHGLQKCRPTAKEN